MLKVLRAITHVLCLIFYMLCVWLMCDFFWCESFVRIFCPFYAWVKKWKAYPKKKKLLEMELICSVCLHPLHGALELLLNRAYFCLFSHHHVVYYKIIVLGVFRGSRLLGWRFCFLRSVMLFSLVIVYVFALMR